MLAFRVSRRWLFAGALLVVLVALLAVFLGGRRAPTPPLPPHTILYTNVQADSFVAVDATTGKKLWRADLGGGTSVPVYADGLLYAMGYWDWTGLTLYALDPASGAQRWTMKLADNGFPGGIWYANGRLYLTYAEYAHPQTSTLQATGPQTTNPATPLLTVLDPRTHTVDWTVRMPGDMGGLLFAGNRIYAPWSPTTPSATGAVIALDAATGAQVWRTPIPGDPYSTPVLSGNTLALSVDGGTVQAMRADTGAPLWTYRPPNWRVGLSPVASANGLLYVGAERTLYALDIGTGTLKWRTDVDGSPGESHQQYAPVILGNLLLFEASNDDTLYRIDPKTGNHLWQYSGIEYGRGTPVLHDGTLYLITGWGGIDAINPADGTELHRYDLQTYGYGVLVLSPADMASH